MTKKMTSRLVQLARRSGMQTYGAHLYLPRNITKRTSYSIPKRMIFCEVQREKKNSLHHYMKSIGLQNKFY